MYEIYEMFHVYVSEVYCLPKAIPNVEIKCRYQIQAVVILVQKTRSNQIFCILYNNAYIVTVPDSLREASECPQLSWKWITCTCKSRTYAFAYATFYIRCIRNVANIGCFKISCTFRRSTI